MNQESEFHQRVKKVIMNSFTGILAMALNEGIVDKSKTFIHYSVNDLLQCFSYSTVGNSVIGLLFAGAMLLNNSQSGSGVQKLNNLSMKKIENFIMPILVTLSATKMEMDQKIGLKKFIEEHSDATKDMILQFKQHHGAYQELDIYAYICGGILAICMGLYFDKLLSK